MDGWIDGWIHAWLLLLPPHARTSTSTHQVLELLHVERYEVPFLWAYRRDYFAQHIPSREV